MSAPRNLTRLNAALELAQRRGRCRQHFQDEVPGGREPRHPAAAQRSTTLCHQPDRARRTRTTDGWSTISMPLSRPSKKSSARLLDMSRLDTGALRPEFASFRIDELMRQIELEFAPLAVD